MKKDIVIAKPSVLDKYNLAIIINLAYIKSMVF